MIEYPAELLHVVLIEFGEIPAGAADGISRAYLYIQSSPAYGACAEIAHFLCIILIRCRR